MVAVMDVVIDDVNKSLLWDRAYLTAHHQEVMGLWVVKLYFPVTIAAIVIGTFGNLLIAAAILFTKELKTPGNYFIVNLAIADMTVTGFGNIWNLLGVVLGKEWFLDRWAMCQVVVAVCGIACVCALLNICHVAITRYIHICKNHLYGHIYTPRNTVLICLATWIVSFLLMELPNITGPGSHSFDLKAYNCVPNRTDTYWWTVVQAFVIFGSPVVITGVCYYKIFSHFRASKKRVAVQGSSNPTDDSKTKVESDKEVKAKRDSHRLAVTLFTIFVAYIVCFTPYTLLVLFDVNDRMPFSFYFIAYTLLHISFSINVALYGVTNKQFRRAYSRLLRLDRCCPRVGVEETVASKATQKSSA